MIELICVVALSAQIIAPYFAWFNRWNVPAHIGIGFCVTAYVIPGLLTNVWEGFPSAVLDAYATINLIGALFLIVGTILGAKLKISGLLYNRLLKLFDGGLNSKIKRRVQLITIIGVVGIIAAYFVMGFIPMFAENPLMAKQFKGEYYEPYYRAAYLFRTSFSVLVACLPVIFTVWWAYTSRFSLFLGLLAAALIAVSLARASTALGFLTFLGFVAATYKGWMKWYLVLAIIVFPLGSAAYLLLGLAIGVESFSSIYSMDSIFDIISSGSPDIFDQLTFLNGFYGHENYTYGRTFIGGLVPGNYMWNPSVWSITYDRLGADISETMSGGLRFSVSMWGYTSFGWFGVVLVPLISGVISGVIISMVRRLPLNKSLIAASLAMTLYGTLGKQLVEFYMMSIHSIPTIGCALFFCFGYARIRRINKDQPVIQDQGHTVDASVTP